MKRTIIGLLGAMALLVAPVVARRAHAQVNNGTGIIGSSHDFSTGSPLALRTPPIGGGSNQICIYCHTPHHATSTQVPLWNRVLDTLRTFTLYSSPTMKNAAVARAPGAVSRACLACHDGVGAISNFGSTTTATDKITTAINIIGTDLSNDHPVGLLLVDGSNPGIKTIAAMKTAGLPFFGAGANQMECATCHEPHNRGAVVTNGRLLRMNNAASALCLGCHIK